MKQFLDFNKSIGTHYGALQALLSVIGNVEAMRMLVLPNLKMYNDDFLKKEMADESKRHDVEQLIAMFMGAFTALVRKSPGRTINGTSSVESLREQLNERIGDVLTDQIIMSNKLAEAQAILDSDISI